MLRRNAGQTNYIKSQTNNRPVCQLFVWVRRFVEVKTSSPDKSDWRSGLRLLQNYWWTIGLGKQLLTGGAAIHQSIIAKDTWEEEWGTRPPCTRRRPAPPWSTLPSTPPRTWASGSSWELQQEIRVVHCVIQNTRVVYWGVMIRSKINRIRN